MDRLAEIEKRMAELRPMLAEYWRLMEEKYQIESDRRIKEKAGARSIWDQLENVNPW
jgi:hypothetical protein